MKNRRRVVIVGGGPIGVECAARAAAEGFEVTLFEAGEIGEHVRQWEHVTLFSPWALNRSSWGMERLRREQFELEDDEEYPTGREYLEHYLFPLADMLSQDVDIREETKVLGISRDMVLKGDHIGGEARARAPFLLRVEGPRGEWFHEADVVIDASGVLSQPNALGPGGLEAIGEEKLNGEVLRRIPDMEGKEGEELRGRRVLVVGHGHSALTTLDTLQEQAPNTRVVWAFRAEEEPCTEIEDDPLPQRARLDRLGNAAARGEVEGIEPRSGCMVYSLERKGDGLEVTLQGRSDRQKVEVDRVVANVGYRPDTSLYRELQVHLCYASDGPMKLAASLLANSGGGDCLAQESAGVETLKNPEPDFFILGAKSYGRNPNFLLRLGFEQIDDVFRHGLTRV